MNVKGNTILITGGGSGIGRGLAESFHKLGNRVIIAGRRASSLDEVTRANPGMASAVLNIEKPESIRQLAAKIAENFPSLNVVINNAGIMRAEKLTADQPSVTDAEAIVTTNLLGRSASSPLCCRTSANSNTRRSSTFLPASHSYRCR